MSDRDQPALEPPPEQRPGRPNLVALRDARERAIELITRRFSEDVIDDSDLERRLERVQEATSLEQIRDLVDDLQAEQEPPSQALVPVGEGSLARIAADAVPDHRRFVSVLGDSRHEGAWTPAREIKSISVIGDTCFDFREARLGPGEVTLTLRSVIGDVTIIVPPGLAIDVDCSAILSDRRRDTPTPACEADDAPRVRVEGLVLIGDIRVEERLPGESRRDARRRRKRERKRERPRRKRLGDGQ